jgi:hypothetical protein
LESRWTFGFRRFRWTIRPLFTVIWQLHSTLPQKKNRYFAVKFLAITVILPLNLDFSDLGEKDIFGFFEIYYSF